MTAGITQKNNQKLKKWQMYLGNLTMKGLEEIQCCSHQIELHWLSINLIDLVDLDNPWLIYG